MKTPSSVRRRSRRFASLGPALCVVALALAGCSDDGDAPSALPVATTSGIVVGSYFRNAKVCLDQNANARCDDGEPVARTDANGRFTLAGSGAAVVAEVGTDAKEYDPARNVETAIALPFVLRAPKEAPGIVSLESTSVMAEMEANALTFADAVKKVAIADGVAAGKLLTDFNRETDATTKASLQAASDEGITRLKNTLALAAGADVRTTVASAVLTDRYYQTKAPYRPQQDVSTYEAPPAGYTLASVQVVARHGSRGLSSLKYDLAVYNMWKKAQDDGALTALGAKLGPDVLKIMKANFVLGYGVPGITTVGYGNETQVGIAEHRQLAVRMLARQPEFWKQVGDTAATAPRRIVFVTSGVDRAVDSGNFFVQSLTATQPSLAALVVRPKAPGPYPDTGTAVPEPDGTNHFLLYFHKLVKATDQVTNTADPLYRTYADSQTYQTYKAGDADLLAKQAGLLTTANAQAAGRAVLERLFTKAFVDKIDAGTYRFTNTGTFTYASDDGKFTSTLSGDGKTAIAGLGDAGSLLYELYVIAPAMRSEAGVDFTVYLPSAQAMFFAYANDASDFYDKGPGMTEKGDATYRIAQILVDDLFKEGDAVARNDLTNAATLRFAHAEIMIPFASRMGLKAAFQQLPKAQTFTYANDIWRGETVSRMAANLQWDVYRNATGKVVVRMLYDEKETDFKAACDGAKLQPASHFYDYAALRTCYGYP